MRHVSITCEQHATTPSVIATCGELQRVSSRPILPVCRPIQPALTGTPCFLHKFDCAIDSISYTSVDTLRRTTVAPPSWATL